MNQIHKLIATGKALKHLQDMEVEKLLTRQVRLLELMSEDIIPEDTDALAPTQVKLANFMTNLTREFRQVKQDLFNLVLDTAKTGNNFTTSFNVLVFDNRERLFIRAFFYTSTTLLYITVK